MIKNLILLVVSLLIMSASCDTAPQKDYYTILYKFNPPVCVEWLDDEDQIIEACPGESLYPGRILGIAPRNIADEFEYEELLVNSCAKWSERCGSAPLKDFEVLLYGISSKHCVEWYNEKDELLSACPEDSNYPEGLIGITPGDYGEEIDYQNKIIYCCSKWKDN